MGDEMGSEQEILEDAIAKRLGKLRSMPVDLSRLDAKLRAAIPAPARADRPRRWAAVSWAMGVAATVLVAIGIGWVALAGSETTASAADIARMHWEVVEGKDVTPARSVADANQLIAAMAQGAVTVPGVPEKFVHACCMRNLGTKRVACVLLKSEGEEPVTMTVAAAGAVKSPKLPAVMVGGVEYHVEKVGELTMVMAERGGRWVCLVSRADQGKLIELAGKLQF